MQNPSFQYYKTILNYLKIDIEFNVNIINAYIIREKMSGTWYVTDYQVRKKKYE
jgi:hypothetical protein